MGVGRGEGSEGGKGGSGEGSVDLDSFLDFL